MVSFLRKLFLLPTHANYPSFFLSSFLLFSFFRASKMTLTSILSYLPTQLLVPCAHFSMLLFNFSGGSAWFMLWICVIYAVKVVLLRAQTHTQAHVYTYVDTNSYCLHGHEKNMNLNVHRLCYFIFPENTVNS